MKTSPEKISPRPARKRFCETNPNRHYVMSYLLLNRPSTGPSRVASHRITPAQRSPPSVGLIRARETQQRPTLTMVVNRRRRSEAAAAPSPNRILRNEPKLHLKLLESMHCTICRGPPTGTRGLTRPHSPVANHSTQIRPRQPSKTKNAKRTQEQPNTIGINAMRSLVHRA